MTAKARPRPCASCPYRRDVPSGVWNAVEYAKLLNYDGETGLQSPAPFFCHQQDGSVCAGWLACHDAQELLAVRIGISMGNLDVSVFDYQTDVPVFSSGAEAARHGLTNVEQPDLEARETIDKVVAARRARRGRAKPMEEKHDG